MRKEAKLQVWRAGQLNFHTLKGGNEAKRNYAFDEVEKSGSLEVRRAE